MSFSSEHSLQVCCGTLEYFRCPLVRRKQRGSSCLTTFPFSTLFLGFALRVLAFVWLLSLLFSLNELLEMRFRVAHSEQWLLSGLVPLALLFEVIQIDNNNDSTSSDVSSAIFRRQVPTGTSCFSRPLQWLFTTAVDLSFNVATYQELLSLAPLALFSYSASSASSSFFCHNTYYVLEFILYCVRRSSAAPRSRSCLFVWSASSASSPPDFLFSFSFVFIWLDPPGPPPINSLSVLGSLALALGLLVLLFSSVFPFCCVRSLRSLLHYFWNLLFLSSLPLAPLALAALTLAALLLYVCVFLPAAPQLSTDSSLYASSASSSFSSLVLLAQLAVLDS